MKKLLPYLVGAVIGCLFTLIAVMNIMPGAMIRIQSSPMDVEATVTALKERAEAQGWVVSGVMAIDESIAKHGGGEVPKVRLINFCQPNYAANILNDPEARHVSVFMPCTIAGYEGDDGATQVSSMNAGLLFGVVNAACWNAGLLGSMMGGTIADVMGKSVARDQAEVLAFLEE